MAEDIGASVRHWVDVVRRAQLGRTVKAVAHALAHYADANGRRIFPGVARLSVECELSYNAVQTALAALRNAGLIEVVRKAAVRDRADEYRLIIAPDLLDRIEVMSPNDVTKAIEKIQAVHRGKHRTKTTPDPHPTAMGAADTEGRDLHPTAMGAEELSTTVDNGVDNEQPHPTGMGAGFGPAGPPAPHGVGAETRPAPHGAGDLHPTASATTSHRPATRTTSHTSADVRTAVTVSRAQGREQDPFSSVNVVEPSAAGYRSRHALDSAAEDDGTPAPDNVLNFPNRLTA